MMRQNSQHPESWYRIAEIRDLLPARVFVLGEVSYKPTVLYTFGGPTTDDVVSPADAASEGRETHTFILSGHLFKASKTGVTYVGNMFAWKEHVASDANKRFPFPEIFFTASEETAPGVWHPTELGVDSHGRIYNIGFNWPYYVKTPSIRSKRRPSLRATTP